VEYIGQINIYFAPTSLETSLRKHIEGCIAHNFRNAYPTLKTFYPNDNRVGVKAQRLGQTLLLRLSEPIAGIDAQQGI
jgi:hypothetical protein